MGCDSIPAGHANAHLVDCSFRNYDSDGKWCRLEWLQTMDAKEFVGALMHFGLLPVRTAQTYAMDTFQRAKRHTIVGDQTGINETVSPS
jgi:hypothetical protein